MTVASGGLGWFMSGRVLRPVRVITETARRASEQHLGERLGLTGATDELKELADTFDEMLERLDAAFATQRRFVANASHELRTPLTVMRTAIDVTLAKPSPTARQLTDMAVRVRRSIDRAESHGRGAAPPRRQRAGRLTPSSPTWRPGPRTRSTPPLPKSNASSCGSTRRSTRPRRPGTRSCWSGW